MAGTQNNVDNIYGADPVIPLRPHHGMCLAHFEGKGYSSAFVSHMQEVLDLLTEEGRSKETEIQVRLTVETDVICEACPHNGNGICAADEKVSGYDRKVLELCGLIPDEIMPFSAFASRVQDRILSPGKRQLVCTGCQWEELCERRRSLWA